MASVTNELRVCRSHLWQAFRQIKRQRGFGDQSAILTFDDGQLKIELGGCVLTADAKGLWKGQVKIPVDVIRNIAKSFAKGSSGDVVVSTDGNELRIEQIAVPCHWDALLYPRIQMPLGAGLTDVLTLPLKYSAEDIDRSELSEALASAEEQRDELIGKATRILRALNVSEVHLRELVDGLLKEKVEYETGDVEE
jgi:hypothetical protein